MGIIQLTRRNKRDAQIDISPLIDMVFILLIFFMVTTTFVKDAKVDIERPGAQTAEQADNRSVRVSVARSGELLVDATPVKPWMLQARLKDILAKQKIETVLVVADRYVETGTLIDIVDQCRLAGAKDVGVAVEHIR